MQLLSLRQTNAAYYFSAATQQINNMIERIKVHDENKDLWDQQNQALLPKGYGIVEGNYPHYHIAVSWGQQSKQPCQTNTIGTSGCAYANITV